MSLIGPSRQMLRRKRMSAFGVLRRNRPAVCEVEKLGRKQRASVQPFFHFTV